MQLIDLCVLDLESLDFPNRILAAAALYHTVSHDITKLTGIYATIVQDNILQTLYMPFPLSLLSRMDMKYVIQIFVLQISLGQNYFPAFSG